MAPASVDGQPERATPVARASHDSGVPVNVTEGGRTALGCPGVRLSFGLRPVDADDLERTVALGENDGATIERRDKMPATTSPRIGFVGLGHMGGSMATRFLAAGYPVYGEERRRAHAQGLLHDGLQWRDTPREVAEAAEIVITSLPDERVLDAVASGPDGILAGLDAETIWVDMSTVSPRASRDLAERVHTLGAAMLDAPVSGSVPQVQAGTLTIMVGATNTRTRASSRSCANSARRRTSARTDRDWC